MTITLHDENDIPEDVLQALASPVLAAETAWYLAAQHNNRWLMATVYPMHDASAPAARQWGVALRGKADPELAERLIQKLLVVAKRFNCNALIADAVPTPGPMGKLYSSAGFSVLSYHQTATACIDEVTAALRIGINGADLQKKGFSLVPMQAKHTEELTYLLVEETGHNAPHVFHMNEMPDVATSIDCSTLLMHDNTIQGGVIACLNGKSADIQALFCRKPYRKHRALAWLLQESAAHIALRADHCVFNFPEHNRGVAKLVKKINAQMLVRQIRHWHNGI